MAKTVLAEYASHLVALETARADKIGEIRYMAHANGYIMVRRPRCQPFILSEKEWLALPRKLQHIADDPGLEAPRGNPRQD